MYPVAPFLHKNGFSRIWQNSTCPERVPTVWMNNYQPYYIHIYTELQWYRIEPRSIFKYYKAMVLQQIACWFTTIYHAGMRSIWIELFCIPIQPNLLVSLIHYLNGITQSTKITLHVRYDNKVMSTHIKKKKIEKD